ncbi:hypothetical protein [Demequina rhizosphaerae]|uniref:hypothetical protein n=1 Tax=Demequina rhizosphaerae TaxID=1638985 RepID=UPI00078591E4|nr:hypothetical protein [Demequina rhizosphaerae]
MSRSVALAAFDRLIGQAEELERVASALDVDDPVGAPIVRRSGFVLAVAALDSFFRAIGEERLRHAAACGGASVGAVASYLERVSSAELGTDARDSLIRYRLGFKTLVSPQSVDRLIKAWGGDPEEVWFAVALAEGSRPDRVRREIDLINDRRNQIAHEGDWDAAQFGFRRMTTIHLTDCTAALRAHANAFDEVLAST